MNRAALTDTWLFMQERGIASAMQTLLRSASFSQFAEDVFCSRFAALPPKGFYVDVGAAYPVENSNTYRFYLKGWHGLTIEPNPLLASAQRRVRPRDVCVAVGVAASAGTLRYHRFLPADYNTFDAQIAFDLQRRGIRSEPPIEVPTLPLSTILAEHAPGRSIDLMSVDCEGMDLVVLQSSDWERFRPTLLMVEDHQQSFRAVVTSPVTQFLQSRSYDLVSRLSYTSFFIDARSLDVT